MRPQTLSNQLTICKQKNMPARETDVMEDEILETELWSSSALAISSGTEQLLMLEGFTDPS